MAPCSCLAMLTLELVLVTIFSDNFYRVKADSEAEAEADAAYSSIRYSSNIGQYQQIYRSFKSRKKDVQRKRVRYRSGPGNTRVYTTNIKYLGIPLKQALLERERLPPTTLNFNTSTLNVAVNEGLQIVNKTQVIEGELINKGFVIKKGSSAAIHFRFFQSTADVRKEADDAMVAVACSQVLSKMFDLSPEQAGLELKAFTLADTIASTKCPREVQCNPKFKYRSYDGTCNNLGKTQWGARNTAMQRIRLPKYSDGIIKPRVSTAGNSLPSARLVSTSLTSTGETSDPTFTLNLMQYGQFLDHDITFTPLFNNEEGSGIKCCDDKTGQPLRDVQHPACFPIEIPTTDPFYQKYNQTCMHFIRSLPGKQTDCSFGYGEQSNQITHFHDASNVYGSSEEDAKELKDASEGLLKIENRKGRQLLPYDKDAGCGIPEEIRIRENLDCFRAGDRRANEQPGLTVYHTIWLREHNRVARLLKMTNPHWDGETIFQESRKIVTAEMQHITYSEWLPIILGESYMDDLEILIEKDAGFSSKYNPMVNPSIVNAFATAAFRFGHTLIKGMMNMVKEDKQGERVTTGVLNLAETFDNPQPLFPTGNIDRILMGLGTQTCQKFDNLFSKQVSNHLFQSKEEKFGMDLVALNIQRGRDHGLPGYNEYRALCGLPRATSFADLSDAIAQDIIEELEEVYDNVDDIDLFIGGVSENPVDTSLLGPTFRCIVGDQFKRLREGDRFFYDSSSSPGQLTLAQLLEIKKTTLARITCDNGDNVKSVQMTAFIKPSEGNPPVDCNSPSIPALDISVWKEDYSPPPTTPTTPTTPTPSTTTQSTSTRAVKRIRIKSSYRTIR